LISGLLYFEGGIVTIPYLVKKNISQFSIFHFHCKFLEVKLHFYLCGYKDLFDPQRTPVRFVTTRTDENAYFKNKFNYFKS